MIYFCCWDRFLFLLFGVKKDDENHHNQEREIDPIIPPLPIIEIPSQQPPTTPEPPPTVPNTPTHINDPQPVHFPSTPGSSSSSSSSNLNYNSNFRETIIGAASNGGTNDSGPIII